MKWNEMKWNEKRGKKWSFIVITSKDSLDNL